jgi:hypothetical protein
VPDAAKPPPAQDEAFVELHDNVEDCPELMLFGLADKEAVVAGGGVVNEPAVQGVSEPAPQQVLKTPPFAGAEGFEVSP